MIREHSVDPAECRALRAARATGKGVRSEKGQQQGNTDRVGQGQGVDS